MIFLLDKRSNNSICEVLNDEKTRIFGVMGQAKDLNEAKILNLIGCKENEWCFIPYSTPMTAHFKPTKDELIQYLNTRLSAFTSPSTPSSLP